MAPNTNNNFKIKATGRKSASYFEGDQKNLCKKWCYHPTHEGTTPVSKRKHKRLSIPVPEGFPLGKRTRKVFHALLSENPEEMKCFLQEGKGGTRKNWCNCSLLHIAARWELPEMIKAMHNSVDPNSVNRFNQTAAHIAALRGETAVLKELMSFDQLDPERKDVWNNTFRDNLAAPLFNDVLWADDNHIQELLELGANPDGHAGKLVEGITARELRVSTPRELAVALNRKSALDLFAENDLKQFPMITVSSQTTTSRIRNTRKGFVSIFTYGSFKDRPDLTCTASKTDANNLAKVFSEMEYNGGVYSSLTAEETLDVLEDIREMEMMEDCESLIFYFSSHVAREDGVHDSFITSDMKALTVRHILDTFKESKCPNHLKDKTKIFIFDLFRESNNNVSKDIVNFCEMNATDIPYSTRKQGKIHNAIGLYSSTGKDITHDGSTFNKTLCNILSEEGHKFTIVEVFDRLKKELNGNGISNELCMLHHNYHWNFRFDV